MSWPSLLTLCLLVSALLLAAYTPPSTPTPGATTPSLPNPASVFCEEHGGKQEFRQDAEGGVMGVCIFSDGSECEEWAYFRGECAPGDFIPKD